MKISHAALYTKNLERICEFYEKEFGARASAPYHNPKTGLRTRFLSFDDGARLEIMNRPETGENTRGEFDCGYAHISFELADNSEVDSIACRIHEYVVNGPRVTGDGYYELCIRDPDGNFVEFVAARP